jgi:hypothetical protein
MGLSVFGAVFAGADPREMPSHWQPKNALDAVPSKRTAHGVCLLLCGRHTECACYYADGTRSVPATVRRRSKKPWGSDKHPGLRRLTYDVRRRTY